MLQTIEGTEDDDQGRRAYEDPQYRDAGNNIDGIATGASKKVTPGNE